QDAIDLTVDFGRVPGEGKKYLHGLSVDEHVHRRGGTIEVLSRLERGIHHEGEANVEGLTPKLHVFITRGPRISIFEKHADDLQSPGPEGCVDPLAIQL